MTICYSICMAGLYIHIPFCTKKCHYCNFVITTQKTSEAHGNFLTALEREIAHYRSDLKNTVFETLYLGGGTPSVLSAEMTNKLFQLIRANFKFKKNAEVTCEANPGDIDQKAAKNYKLLGVNRMSLGAQSFQNETLKRLNRCHGVTQILDSFQILRDTGFRNINLDLILSLPGEALDDVRHSLSEVLKLGPEHVSLYELVVEEKTVFGNLKKKGELRLPEETLQIEMLSLARETLKASGFDHYELLSYAKPGFRSRHNLIYWANQEYLGLGPGAFSYLRGRRFRNSSSYMEYLQKIKKRDWSAFEEEKLSPEKKEIESLLLALRLKEGASEWRFRSLFREFEPHLKSLKAKGLVERKKGYVRLTDRGQFFAETVFSELSGL